MIRALPVLGIAIGLASCGAPDPSTRAGPMDTPRAQFDRATRCLGATWSVTRLPRGRFGTAAEHLYLQRITPKIAERWLGMAELLGQRLGIPATQARLAAEKQVQSIETIEQLEDVTDEAVDCATVLGAVVAGRTESRIRKRFSDERWADADLSRSFAVA